jgi:hypothetical protein
MYIIIKFGLSMFLKYPCIPSASISPDNGEYTEVPTLLVRSPKVPRAYEPLNLALPVFLQNNNNHLCGITAQKTTVVWNLVLTQ